MGKVQNSVFASSAAAVSVCLFALGFSYPAHMAEDALTENATAGGFLAAALVALARAVLWSKHLQSETRYILIATAGFALLLFASEISFGARLGFVEVPAMYGGGEFDGGHDIVLLVARLMRDSDWFVRTVSAVPIVLLIGIGSYALCSYRTRLLSLAQHAISEPFPFRLIVATGLLASGVIIDLIPSYKASILEEVLELMASGVLLFAVTTRPKVRLL